MVALCLMTGASCHWCLFIDFPCGQPDFLAFRTVGWHWPQSRQRPRACTSANVRIAVCDTQERYCAPAGHGPSLQRSTLLNAVCNQLEVHDRSINFQAKAVSSHPLALLMPDIKSEALAIIPSAVIAWISQLSSPTADFIIMQFRHRA